MVKKSFKERYRSLLFSIVSLFLVYSSGFFSSSTKFEQLAEYATRIVKEHTKNKKYAAITVQSTKDSGSIADTDNEFHSLYGVFRQQKITFATTMNSNKDHEIFLGNKLTENLSVLYIGPVGSSVINNQIRHYTYPINLMFDDESYYNVNKYVIYISKSHADRIMDGLPGFVRDEKNQYNENDYRSLIKSTINIEIDKNIHNVLVQNIYYENGYFYEGLREVMGDFVISSYYFPENLTSERENMYFLSEYTYQNEYFMKYINEIYGSKKFNVRLNHFNIVGEVDDDYFLNFYYTEQLNRLNWISIMLLCLSGFLLLLSFLFFAYYVFRNNMTNSGFTALNIAALFLPYIVSKLLYIISSNVVFMSAQSGTIFLWFTGVYIFAIFITLIIKGIMKNRKDIFCEVDL